MNPLFQRLLANGPAVTDGAWGTQLQARGLAIGACPDVWNISNPHLVAEVAASYIAAGSQVILTNTFGASQIALERHGLADKAARINLTGAALSREAAGRNAYVFGSIGPSGKMLAMGDISPSTLSAAFREQAKALAAGGADALVIETMSDLEEAAIALTAAKETGLPVVACMTYGAGKHADRTIMGTTPEEAATTLIAAGADAIGANCGQGALQMLPLCSRLKAVSSVPIWMKPNAGLPEIIDGRAVYTVSPEEFTRNIIQLVAAGADFVGGCCGTGPEYIRTLKRSLANE